MRFLAPLLVAALAAVSLAQEGRVVRSVDAVQQGGHLMVELGSLARALGLGLSVDESAATLRSDAGVLTLFRGAPEALWQPVGADAPEDLSLRAPPRIDAGGWWVPLDVPAMLGLEHQGEAFVLPDGGTLHLAVRSLEAPGRHDLVDLGAGVRGLRLTVDTDAGRQSLSALVTDLGLLSLSRPQHREVLDGVLASPELAEDRPLLVVVTSTVDQSWQPAISFVQDGVPFEARHPYRLQLIRGDADRIEAGEPVVAVALLPRGYRLDRPIEVRWGGATGTITFRR